jgi:mono/diheme cytochrome c family protein
VRLGWATGAVAVLALTPLLIVLTNRLQEERQGIGGASAAAEASPGGGLFADTCGSCHVLEAAGTKGAAGPNLDELAPSAQRVLRAIERAAPAAARCRNSS